VNPDQGGRKGKSQKGERAIGLSVIRRAGEKRKKGRLRISVRDGKKRRGRGRVSKAVPWGEGEEGRGKKLPPIYKVKEKKEKKNGLKSSFCVLFFTKKGRKKRA